MFQHHNPNQRSHGSTYLTSSMAHVQSFEILSTKCVWSFDFIFIDIQLAKSSWIHWHLVVRHNPCMVHMFVEASIIFVQWLWNISWKVQYHLWKFKQRMHIYYQNTISLSKITFNYNITHQSSSWMPSSSQDLYLSHKVQKLKTQ